MPAHNNEGLGELLSLMEENKGLLLVWAIQMLEIWENVYAHGMEYMMDALTSYLQDFEVQGRWLRGVSTLILADTLSLFVALQSGVSWHVQGFYEDGQKDRW